MSYDTCSCEVYCNDQSFRPEEKETGQGQTGKKLCALIAGDKDNAAYAHWVTDNRDMWPKPGKAGTAGWDEMPSCTSPLTLYVVDGTTSEPLSGASIEIFDSHDSRNSKGKITTESNGKMKFSTALTDLLFVVKKDGYNDYRTSFNRVEYCINPTQCEMKFAISKKLNSDDLHPNGCYFKVQQPRWGKKKSVRFEMRAVLEWNQKPDDLDIWVRNVDCAESVRQRYECWGSDEPKFKAPWRERWKYKGQCRRGEFQVAAVRDREKQACEVRRCQNTRRKPHATVFKNSRGDCRGLDKTGCVPKCFDEMHNQFPKWVMWYSRYMGALDKEMDGRTGKASPRTASPFNTESWSSDHYMLLDVDQRQGRGPETVTFHNVPPGNYQIVVDQWSNEQTMRDRRMEYIKASGARVKIYLGGNKVVFECEMNPSCTAKARTWNVANIAIEEAGMEGDYVKYRIKLVDAKSQIPKIYPANLPFKGKPAWVRQFYGPPRRQLEVEEQYFERAAQPYNEDDLNQCYSTCKPMGGVRGYDDCLVH
jgi:hypothetical protein